MNYFRIVSFDHGPRYVAVSFVHLPFNDRYYCQVDETDHGQVTSWFVKNGVGLGSLRTTWEGIPLGGVEFALTHLVAYRLRGNVSPA